MPVPPDPILRVRRRPDRAGYDADEVAAILDAGFVCHVAVVRDGRPVVIPMLYARDSDRVLLHGSTATGLFRDLARDPRVCVEVTHVDALVLARSAFHHSLNYRSVVVHGEAELITSDAEKADALRILLDHITPGQWRAVRQPSPGELRQTDVWAVSLARASAKSRSGPPADDVDDQRLPVWAGLLPLTVQAGPPVPDEHVPDRVPPPAHLVSWPGAAAPGS